MIHSHKLNVFVSSLFLSFICSVSLSSSISYAYVLSHSGYVSATYTADFGYSRYNSTWTDRINAAVNSWNNTPTPVNISHNSNSINKIYVDSYADTWYGHYSGERIAGYVVDAFTIYLNSRTINNTATDWNHFVESTAVHEIGHSLNLDHNSETSIMNSSRNRNVMYTPQQDDINGVNASY